VSPCASGARDFLSCHSSLARSRLASRRVLGGGWAARDHGFQSSVRGNGGLARTACSHPLRSPRDRLATHPSASRPRENGLRQASTALSVRHGERSEGAPSPPGRRRRGRMAGAGVGAAGPVADVRAYASASETRSSHLRQWCAAGIEHAMMRA